MVSMEVTAREEAASLPGGDARAAQLLHIVFGLSKDFCASGLRMGCLHTRNALLTRVRGEAVGKGRGGGRMGRQGRCRMCAGGRTSAACAHILPSGVSLVAFSSDLENCTPSPAPASPVTPLTCPPRP